MKNLKKITKYNYLKIYYILIKYMVDTKKGTKKDTKKD